MLRRSKTFARSSAQWHAPLGVYCVPGTPEVEPLPRVLEFVEGLDNLTLLTNRWVTVKTPCGALHILGMITTHDLKTDREALAHMMESAPAEGAEAAADPFAGHRPGSRGCRV